MLLLLPCSLQECGIVNHCVCFCLSERVSLSLYIYLHTYRNLWPGLVHIHCKDYCWSCPYLLVRMCADKPFCKREEGLLASIAMMVASQALHGCIGCHLCLFLLSLSLFPCFSKSLSLSLCISGLALSLSLHVISLAWPCAGNVC